MRIEKREDGVWLIGAPVESNDCAEIYDGCPCDTHFDGEHLSTGTTDEHGRALILARWPIEPAPAPQPERLFSTPAEARAASAEHLREIAAVINRKLAAGQRWFSVPQPLFDEVRRGLEAAGWRVMLGGAGAGGQSFTVAESSKEQEGER